MADKHDVIIRAVESMKKADHFGLTAIKVELEEQLQRNSTVGDRVCENCDEGRVTCGECDGNWDTLEDCMDCDGSGRCSCDEEDCDALCGSCDGTGYVTDYCECCNEGWETCSECDGAWENVHHFDEEDTEDWRSVEFCQQYLLEKLSVHGMSEQDMNGIWKVKAPLAFAKFYYDGSVDSEFTFTVLMDNPENVFLIEKVIDAWNEFAEAVKADGGTRDVRGAGMHTALINMENGYYNRGDTQMRPEDRVRFKNFKRSMTLLLPALFFLSATNEETRTLGFRKPGVSCPDIEPVSSRTSAINYMSGALEFRLFDTCYDNPSIILDNIVVISKTMRYWTTEYTRNNLSNIANNIRFGLNNQRELARHYVTKEHLRLLNRGLRLLKPDYYTIRELKKQRNFTLTEKHLNNGEKKAQEQAARQYLEYEERFGWNMVIHRNEAVADAIRDYVYKRESGQVAEKPQEVVEQEAQERAEEALKRFKRNKKRRGAFIEQKINEYRNRPTGEYALAV